MSFNKNSSSTSTSNNKFAVLAKQFNRECQNSDPLPTCAAPAPPAHTSARPKSPCAPAQPSSSGALAPSTSNKETKNSKPVFTTTVRPLKVVNKSKPGSYAHAAARGVSPGSAITPRSRSKSLHPIWDPACPRIEEWYKVEKDDFVFTKNVLDPRSALSIKRTTNMFHLGKVMRSLPSTRIHRERKSTNGFLTSMNPAYHRRILSRFQITGAK